MLLGYFVDIRYLRWYTIGQEHISWNQGTSLEYFVVCSRISCAYASARKQIFAANSIQLPWIIISEYILDDIITLVACTGLLVVV